MADKPGVVSAETAREARVRADQYKQALAYLNTCGEMTFEKYREAHRLTGAGMSEWEVRGLWEGCVDAFVATHDLDYARTHLRQILEKAIKTFEEIAAAGQPPTDPPPADPVPRPLPEQAAPPSHFSFPCPHCSRRVSAPRFAAGKNGRCPRCGQKCRIPYPEAESVPGPAQTGRAAPAGDLPLVDGEEAGYKNRLISTNDPSSRLKLGISLCDVVAENGNREAAEAVLTSLACDDRGEVSIGLASALAHLCGPYAGAVRKLILETYGQTGDRTFFGGMPLLRLAYVAALQRDLARLKELAALRAGDNGAALVEELVGYVEQGKDYGVYRVMAWGEGLDGSFQPAILETLPDRFPDKSALLAGLTESVAYITRHEDYR